MFNISPHYANHPCTFDEEAASSQNHCCKLGSSPRPELPYSLLPCGRERLPVLPSGLPSSIVDSELNLNISSTPTVPNESIIVVLTAESFRRLWNSMDRKVRPHAVIFVEREHSLLYSLLACRSGGKAEPHLS